MPGKMMAYLTSLFTARLGTGCQNIIYPTRAFNIPSGLWLALFFKKIGDIVVLTSETDRP